MFCIARYQIYIVICKLCIFLHWLWEKNLNSDCALQSKMEEYRQQVEDLNAKVHSLEIEKSALESQSRILEVVVKLKDDQIKEASSNVRPPPLLLSFHCRYIARLRQLTQAEYAVRCVICFEQCESSLDSFL